MAELPLDWGLIIRDILITLYMLNPAIVILFLCEPTIAVIRIHTKMASKLAVNWIYCPLLGPINVNKNQREAQHKHICKSQTESFLNYPRSGNFACLGMGTEIWELKLLTIISVSQILSLFFQLLLMELQYFWSLPSNAFRSQTIHLYRSQSWHFQPAPVVVVNFFRVTRPGMPVKNNARFFFHDDVVS